LINGKELDGLPPSNYRGGKYFNGRDDRLRRDERSEETLCASTDGKAP
jgi:hypothetical protein